MKTEPNLTDSSRERELKIEKLIKNVTQKVAKKYSKVKITYASVGMGGLFFFNVSCRGIIPADDVLKEPTTSIAISELSEESLIKNTIETLDKYSSSIV